AAARPPLTETGIAAFAELLAATTNTEWQGGGSTTSPVSGTWNTSNTGSLWNNGAPITGSNVFLSGSAGTGYTVTVASGNPAVDSLTINFANASNTSAFANLNVGANTLNVNATTGTPTDNITLSNQAIVTI